MKEQENLYDRLYKASLLFLVAFIAGGVIIGVRQVYKTTDRIDQRSEETQKSLGCIAKFFTATDRVNLTVENLELCTLRRQ